MMPSNNLPSQPTPFVGREKEQAAIAALLTNPACRLLTLVGPGGIGKTRLGLQVATDFSEQFADGVVIVPLAPINSPDLLSAAIANPLQLPFFGVEEPRVQLMNYLRDRQMLLVVDNFEHLLDGANLLSELLEAAPSVKILSTSRERLNLQEEWVFTLDGLAYPTESTTESPENYGAVQLFIQRAHQTQTHFSLEGNVPAVLAICRQVEGMPLALELAATWLRAMSCGQIASQMTGDLDFLATPLRNIPERHRSLRRVFTQSWTLLSADEQTILMKLSVFRGGFDQEAAGVIAGATLPLLAGLVDKSLVRLDNLDRYDLHELLRQFAASQLLDASLTEATMHRHVEYFLGLAEQAEAHQFGRDQVIWYDRLDNNLDNLRTALAWSAELEIGLRLAATLGGFFAVRSHWNEGLIWLEQALSANPNAPALLRAKALNHAGSMLGHMGSDRPFDVYFDEAYALASASHDLWNMGWACSHSGLFASYSDLKFSIERLEDSVALFREMGDQMGLAHALVRLSWKLLPNNDLDYASTVIDEAATLTEQAGDNILMGWVIWTKGRIVRWLTGSEEQAKIHFERCLSLFQKAHYPDGMQQAYIHLADVERISGNLDRADGFYRQAIALNRRELPTLYRATSILAGLANIAKAHGHLERAACLLGAAYDEGYVQFVRNLPPNVNPYLTDIDEVRVRMGDTAFEVAWAMGKAMTERQVADYALEDEAAPIQKAPASSTNSHPLTEREREILHLLADGLNSREIAEKLVISVKTVRWYLRIIYDKLDVHSRSEALARARTLHLLT